MFPDRVGYQSLPHFKLTSHPKPTKMKFVLFAIVVLAAALAVANAAFIPSDIDVGSLDPYHAKVLLGLAQHKCANSTEAECRAFFEPAPFDHCCKVYVSTQIKSAPILDKMGKIAVHG
jgi:hypothetical protein